MKKTIYAFLAASVLVGRGYAATPEIDTVPLPNYALPSEIAQTNPSDWDLNIPLAMEAPAFGLRLPAEYEPISAVVMSYAAYGSFLSNLAREISNAGVKVVLLGGPSSIAGVEQANYVAPNVPFNSVWSRDYGPVAINEATGELAIVDTIYRHYAYRKSDDKVPQNVADYFGMESYQAPIILDGGNLMVDRRGHLYMTERTYDWNRNLSREQVDQYLIDYFGVEKIHVFPYARSGSQPADGTGHIDMFAKIVDDCKVIVAQATREPFATPLEFTANYFAQTECAPGQNWDVYRVKGWASGRVWYTYTNSLMVNNTVLIPSYRSDDPTAALKAYRAALPEHKLVTVNSDQVITAAGAIHCTTREIPALSAL